MANVHHRDKGGEREEKVTARFSIRSLYRTRTGSKREGKRGKEKGGSVRKKSSKVQGCTTKVTMITFSTQWRREKALQILDAHTVISPSSGKREKKGKKSPSYSVKGLSQVRKKHAITLSPDPL